MLGHDHRALGRGRPTHVHSHWLHPQARLSEVVDAQLHGCDILIQACRPPHMHMTPSTRVSIENNHKLPAPGSTLHHTHQSPTAVAGMVSSVSTAPACHHPRNHHARQRCAPSHKQTPAGGLACAKQTHLPCLHSPWENQALPAIAPRKQPSCSCGLPAEHAQQPGGQRQRIDGVGTPGITGPRFMSQASASRTKRRLLHNDCNNGEQAPSRDQGPTLAHSFCIARKNPTMCGVRALPQGQQPPVPGQLAGWGN